MTRSIWASIVIALISAVHIGAATCHYSGDQRVLRQSCSRQIRTLAQTTRLESCMLCPAITGLRRRLTPTLMAGGQSNRNATLPGGAAGSSVRGCRGFYPNLDKGWAASEAVIVTATTCPLQGGSTSTATFTPGHNHTAGQYKLSSASQGIQEAINAANFIPTDNSNPQLGKVIIPPGEYTLQARVTVIGSRQFY